MPVEEEHVRIETAVYGASRQNVRVSRDLRYGARRSIMHRSRRQKRTRPPKRHFSIFVPVLVLCYQVLLTVQYIHVPVAFVRIQYSIVSKIQDCPYG